MNNQISLSVAQRALFTEWLEQEIEGASAGSPRINLQHEGIGLTTSYDVTFGQLIEHLAVGGNAVVIYPGNELFRVSVVDHPENGLMARFSGSSTTTTLPLEQQ